MDDGARTSRYAPYFANTGFYLVRANPRTQQFMSELMFACVVARSRARARAPARERCALRARARLCPFPRFGAEGSTRPRRSGSRRYDLNIAWQSHQAVVCQFLVDHSSRLGLGIKILSKPLFPSGKMYHHQKEYMKTVVQKTVEPPPWVFHMCWTANKGEKLRCVPSRAPLPSPP
jgi:hypothetical protein